MGGSFDGGIPNGFGHEVWVSTPGSFLDESYPPWGSISHIPNWTGPKEPKIHRLGGDMWSVPWRLRFLVALEDSLQFGSLNGSWISDWIGCFQSPVEVPRIFNTWLGKAQESDASRHWNKRTAIRQELDQFEGWGSSCVRCVIVVFFPTNVCFFPSFLLGGLQCECKSKRRKTSQKHQVSWKFVGCYSEAILHDNVMVGVQCLVRIRLIPSSILCLKFTDLPSGLIRLTYVGEIKLDAYG